MAKAAVASIELEAIDRLEQKLKQLVAVLDKTRSELMRAKDENGRVHGELDAAYVGELAAYVQRKMELAARESPAGDTLKIAVLAALNIADECFRAREEGSAQQNGVTARALALEAILDLALADGGEPLARAAGSH